MVGDKPGNDPTPAVIASQWAARIMTVAAEMVLPGLLGYWVDNRLGTRVVFLLLGFGAGCSFGIWHLVRMTSRSAETHGAIGPADKRRRRGQ